MKKGRLILLWSLVLGMAAFAGFYYLGTASCRNLMHEPQPELAWLKKEFDLSDAEFARISRLHEAYLPQCAERCRRIEEQSQRLQALLSQSTNLTPEIQAILVERASIRAECETEMLRHFLEVSRTMPEPQGRRYLEWVEQQTLLRGQPMEQRHYLDRHPSTSHEPHA
jgi:hypothetical protein